MRKKIVILSFIILQIFLTFNASAFKIDFVTPREVVNKIKKRFNKLNTLQAYFIIKSEKLGKRTVQRGRVRYKSNNKLLIEFSNGQKIVSNGKMMWIYIPQLNVVAEQDLNVKKGLFVATKSGLKRLFAKYHYRYASKGKKEKLNDNEYITLFLKQRESRSGFRTMKLWITNDYLIKRAIGKSSTGKKVDITFSRIKTNVSMKNGIFKFDIPSSARVIKNPMMSEVK